MSTIFWQNIVFLLGKKRTALNIIEKEKTSMKITFLSWRRELDHGHDLDRDCNLNSHMVEPYTTKLVRLLFMI